MLRKLLGPLTAVRGRRRRTAIVASLPVVLAAAILALAGGSGGGTARTFHGLVRASSSATVGSTLASGRSETSFGPNVYTGIYQGESPPVASLPVLPVNIGPVHANGIESLRQGGDSHAQDQVVQHRKGSGPLSTPIQNFDGICLPAGPPCAQPSSCSCLPPDTEGEVGATQYLQAVNTDFAVYSKTGAVLRTSTPIIGMLPGDLDGSTQPPEGSPNWFAEVDDPTGVPPTNPNDTGFDLRMWAFHVDWTNPANSTFGNNGAPNATLPVAAFVRPQCVYGYGDCTPQKGGPQQLDVLGDRLMFRMPYRNFGSYASLVLNHSVHANGKIGIRWYEVRIPRGGTPSIYQQGTYAPDDATTNPLWRWMGSIAEDRNGDMALGYSASGPNDFPSVRYMGRAAGDTLGQMTQTEQVAYTGTGPQTEVEGRWGDYSDLTVDPSDDCTFWYTQQYLATDTVLLGTWRTRIVSFKFPGCRH